MRNLIKLLFKTLIVIFAIWCIAILPCYVVAFLEKHLTLAILLGIIDVYIIIKMICED